MQVDEKAVGEEKMVVPSTGWTRPFWLRWGPRAFRPAEIRLCPVEIKASSLHSPQPSSGPLPRTQLTANLCGSGTTTSRGGFCSSPSPPPPFLLLLAPAGPGQGEGKGPLS